MSKLLMVYFIVGATYVAAQSLQPELEPRPPFLLECGGLLDGPSGRFTSPLYPSKYPNGKTCEWMILVEEGHIIEIKFGENFEVENPYDFDAPPLNDYVLVFDAEDESTMKYLHRSDIFFNPATDLVYRSKSNMVIVKFESDENLNYMGFEATYDSWDAVSYCEKSQLFTGREVSEEDTTCQDEIKNGFYRTCFVSCSPGFVLRSSSRVTCQNGKFLPQSPCKLIAWEVQLCDITNLEYCRYSPAELSDYWTKEMMKSPQADDAVDFELFPDPGDSVPPLVGAFGISLPGRAIIGSTSSPGGIEVECTDKLLKYSYCARKRNKDYAFSCQAFLRLKKLKKKVATRKMNTCFKCRAIDCTSVVYI